MDRKSIIVLVVSFLLLILWYPLVVNRLYPPKSLPAGTNTIALTTGDTNLTAAELASTTPPPPPALEPATPGKLPYTAVAGEEKTVELTNSLAHYTFTSRGGGLKEVELLQYPEKVGIRGAGQSRSRGVASLNSSAPIASFAFFGGGPFESEEGYQLSVSENGVRAEKSLTNGITIVKDYQLSTNYLLVAKVSFQNHSNIPVLLPAHEWIVGTATPIGTDADSTTLGVMWYNGSKARDVGPSHFSSRGFMCMPRVAPTEYREGASNVVWIASHNQFFTLAAMPQNPADSVVVRKVQLPLSPNTNGRPAPANQPPPEGYVSAMAYQAFALAPNQTVERTVHFFAGPKEYQTLARLGSRFNNNIDLVMGYGGFFGFFAKALLLALNWLHDFIRLPYGWAIVVITVVIKMLFWPLTAASTRSMKRLAALQPQMKAIQEKYKDDPAKMNRKTMEFMREHKVSPLGGCLPMLLQIPVFFGFFMMIRSAIELRGAEFLWVTDLSQPDTLFYIPGTGFPFNLLPLIMGVTMFWQARLTPPSPGMDPTQAKIMRYMPLMFMVFLYNFSAGLTLYWTVQNLLTILQTKLTKTADQTPATVPAVSAKPTLTPPQKKKK